jgi:hypothetical protein
MGVEQFNVDNVLKVLAQHGVTPEDPANSTNANVAANKVRVVTRGATREMFVGDPAGIVFQLHDVSYCGGNGPLGNMCQPEPAPKKGLIAVKDESLHHQRCGAPFYVESSVPEQAMQAATLPTELDRAHLMFTGGGGAVGPHQLERRRTGRRDTGGGRTRRSGGGRDAGANIDHACMHSITSCRRRSRKRSSTTASRLARSDGHSSPISRSAWKPGGAPVTGTPELYFTDPDGLAIQLQDTKYCGGGGYLGDVCPG